MLILFPSVFIGLSILWDRQFGFLQEVLVAPVSRLSIVIRTTLGGATIAMIQGFIVLFIALILGINVNMSLLLILVPIFMLLSSFVAIGIGLIIASKMQSIEGFQFIVSLFIFPLLFLASPFSLLGSLPPVLRAVAFIDPMAYGIDSLRASLIGFSYFPIYISLTVLVALSAITMALGSYFFSRSEV
jgi:ABC-2 type transport system permease protein